MSHRKLGRNSAARKALLKSLLIALFKYERIETTEAKAKELRRVADNVITLAKRGDLSARRMAIAAVGDVGVVRVRDGEGAPRPVNGLVLQGNARILNHVIDEVRARRGRRDRQV